MSTVSFEAFLPEVVQFVPDVPELVATNAIKHACIEFCERTRYWQEDIDPEIVAAGVASYQVDVPTGTKLVDVVEAWYNDVLLIPKSTEEITRIYRFTDWRTVQADPTYITRMIPTELVLVPMPVKSGGALKIRAALAPTRASSTIDSSVYEEFLEYIAYGARARLYNSPKQPYFDKPSAMEFEKKFRASISEVRARVNKGLSRSAVQVEYARFV
jgi:hypothetical protein